MTKSCKRDFTTEETIGEAQGIRGPSWTGRRGDTGREGPSPREIMKRSRNENTDDITDPTVEGRSK